MMWSASSLVRNCAHVTVIKRDKPRSAALDEAGKRGTQFHAAIEKWHADGEPPQVDDLEMQGWIDLLAAQWRPPTGVRFELAWGLSLTGQHVMVAEPEPHKYEAMDGTPLLTAGRVDACWMAAASVLRVVDWKTGKWPVDHPDRNLQVNAGAYALAKRFDVAWYIPGIYYARDGWFEWGTPVEMQSREADDRLADVAKAALLDETPRPGEWCERCWERKACTAYGRAA